MLGGGGFDTSSLTQISGANGTGKTQLCFQLCVNVQLPAELGGLDGEALFIDTNKTFSSNRICEIAHHTLLNYSPGRIPHKSCEKDFLSGVHVYECIHGVELYGMSQRIMPILERLCKVRLIIIDNLASALRSEEDVSHRTKLLTAIGTTLHKIAFTRNILIVVTNQVTTKFRTNDNRGVIDGSFVVSKPLNNKKLGLLRLGDGEEKRFAVMASVRGSEFCAARKKTDGLSEKFP